MASRRTHVRATCAFHNRIQGMNFSRVAFRWTQAIMKPCCFRLTFRPTQTWFPVALWLTSRRIAPQKNSKFRSPNSPSAKVRWPLPIAIAIDLPFSLSQLAFPPDYKGLTADFRSDYQSTPVNSSRRLSLLYKQSFRSSSINTTLWMAMERSNLGQILLEAPVEMNYENLTSG